MENNCQKCLNSGKKIQLSSETFRWIDVIFVLLLYKIINMTKLEKESLIESVLSCLRGGGYLKGYGDKLRLLDKDHNPIVNVSKKILDEINDHVQLNGLLYVIKLSD